MPDSDPTQSGSAGAPYEPRNLPVPVYAYLTDTKIRIG
jgi:hypothetical protein